MLRVCSADGPWSPCADFHHSNDYWDQTLNRCTDSTGALRFPVDLWLTDAPAHGMNGTTNGSCAGVQDYEEWKFGQRAVDIIGSHNTSQPLFLMRTHSWMREVRRSRDCSFARPLSRFFNPAQAKKARTVQAFEPFCTDGRCPSHRRLPVARRRNPRRPKRKPKTAG